MKKESIERSLSQQVADFEKALLIRAFKKTKGNITAMALILKTDRPNLHRKLKTLGLIKPIYD